MKFNFKKIIFYLLAFICVFTLFVVPITNKNTYKVYASEDSDEATYYTSYRKFYAAEVKDDEDVSFITVTDYVKKLYDEGVRRFETDGFESLRVYRDYFKDFYLYWYDISGFLKETNDNIGSDHVDVVYELYNDIIDFVDRNDIESAKAKINELITYLYNDANTLNDLGIYADKAEIIDVTAQQVEAGASYYMTYNQFIKAENPNGDKTITYTEVAKQINNLLNEGLNRYINGEDYSSYYKPFENSYGYWYETSGFEKKTMMISGARVTAVELQFASMKQTVRSNGSAEAIQNEIDKLMSMLNEDAKKLDDLLGLSSGSNGSSGLALATFLGCFTILVREGLEAILILGAIVAYLIKTGNKKQTKYVYIGAVVAIAASFLAAWLLTLLNLTGVPQEIIEGVTALIAVGVLIYVSNWMISKSESDAWQNYISDKVSDSSQTGKIFTLAFTSFLAVFREGAEVILFYQPLIASAKTIDHGMLAVFGGMGLGFLVVIAVFVLIRMFSIKIPLKPFFTITSIFMGLMAVVFLGSGIWELFIDGGIWPVGIIDSLSWMAEKEILNFFGIYPTWLTIIPQLILLAVEVVTFILWKKKSKNHQEEVAQTEATNDVAEENNEVVEESNNSTESNT